MTLFLSGGAKCGKSSLAQDLALAPTALQYEVILANILIKVAWKVCTPYQFGHVPSLQVSVSTRFAYQALWAYHYR